MLNVNNTYLTQIAIYNKRFEYVFNIVWLLEMING